MTPAVRALARGAWLERINQGWRSSRGKVGLWPPALQVGVAALFLWRLAPSPTPVPLLVPATAMAAVGAVGAFVAGLLLGREQLYGRSVLRVLHVSPASGGSILMGLTLATLPQRLFSSLLVALVTGWLFPVGSLWWGAPLLWLLALLTSLAGYGAALVTLVGCVRVSPRSLAVLWGLAVVLGFNLIVMGIGLLTLGVPAAAVAPALGQAAPWLLGAVGLLVLLPVLTAGVLVARRPERAGDWYREAYLTMQEWTAGRRQTRASRWPRVLPGPAGALQARLWREAWLNWFTWVRVGFLLLVPALLIWRPHTLVTMADRFPVGVVVGFGLTAVLGAFGELPAAMGGSDGPAIGLSMVAGVRAARVVTGKWVALLPLALLSAASTWVIALIAQRPAPALTLAAGCIGLGFGAVGTAGGLFDLDPLAEPTEREVPDLLRAALEQMPRKTGAVVGYFGGVSFAAGAVWLCQRAPGALLWVAAGSAALSHLALVAAWLRLKRLGL